MVGARPSASRASATPFADRDTPARTSCTPSCATSRPAVFDGSPRLLGTDEHGREVLTYIDGKTIDSSPVSLSDGRLVSAAQLIRRFHDTTAGTALVQTGRRSRAQSAR
jgi:hypothetical protein